MVFHSDQMEIIRFHLLINIVDSLVQTTLKFTFSLSAQSSTIKPYISYADSHADARCGFVDERKWPKLEVVFPDSIKKVFSKEEIDVLRQTLALDPRPHYQNDPQKVYGMPFAGRDVHFRVDGGVLVVGDIS